MNKAARAMVPGPWLALLLLVGTWPGQSLAIDEILVTAERREESLQRVAISLSALPGETLTRAGIDDTEALAGLVPGLQVQRDVIGKVVIRGIGAENFTIAGDPGVAINVDGAYVSRPNSAIFDLFDVERVEVLRGPQGTLYGRNATGGAINILSRQPTDALDGYLSLDGGNYSKIRAEGAVSGPIGETVAVRVAGLLHQRDGYTDNIFPNVGRGLDELDDKDLWAARALLRWDISSDVTLDLKAEIYRDDSNPIPYKYTDDPVVYFGSRNDNATPDDPTDDFVVPGIPFPNPTAGDLFTVSQGFEPTTVRGQTFGNPFRSDQENLQATLSWNLPGGLTFRSITAYRHLKFDWLNDGDGLEEFLVTYFQNDESDLFTQELQLLSATDGPLTWVAGLYYLNEDSDTFTGIPINGFDDLLINGTAKTDAYAIFGQASYMLSDILRLTVGARYSYEEKEVDYLYDRFSAVLGPDLLIQVSDKNDWNSVTPRLGLDWFWSGEVMFYGTITKGFKSGGFNLLAVQSSYDEEEVWNYEVGVKSLLLDGRLRLNANVFYMNYDDLQVGRVVNLSATIENAAKATMYGAEIEATAAVTDHFQVDFGLSLLQTEYDRFITEDPGYQLGDNAADPADDPFPPDCGTLVSPTDISLRGCDLPRAPNYSGFLGARYNQPLAGGELELSGTWTFVDDQFFTQFNRTRVAQPSYSLLNARATWTTGSGIWLFSIYGENLTDKGYFTNALESGVPTPTVDPVVPQYFVGPPRTFGATVTYRFGGVP